MEERTIISLTSVKRRKLWKLCAFSTGESVEIPEELVFFMALKQGMTLNEKKYTELITRAEKARGKEKAFILLSFRERSENELRMRLKQSGIKPPSARAIIDDLKNLDLVNDEAFAHKYVKNLMQKNPAGAPFIKNELYKKRIPEHIINQVISTLFAETPPVEFAQRCANQWLLKHKHIPQEKRREKLIRYLFQRGFSWQDIEETAGELT